MQFIVFPCLLNLSNPVQDGIGVQQTEAFSKEVSDPGILSGKVSLNHLIVLLKMAASMGKFTSPLAPVYILSE